MEKSNFLNNLKNAVDKGEFNSDAAKKINEINELANEKERGGNIGKSLDDRIKKGGVKTVTEEEAVKINSDYEKKMNELKRVDNFNNLVSKIHTIDKVIDDNIREILDMINEVEEKFDDLNSDDKKIKCFKTKYKSIIN